MSPTKTFLAWTGFGLLTLVTLTSSLWMPKIHLHRSKAIPVTSTRYSDAIPTSATSADSLPCIHYGHAVLPCGIQTFDDLHSLVPLYKNFDFSKVKLEPLDHDILGFVSYKLNGKIYWTSRIEKIPAGEVVWTDGNGNYIRARCGNLISLVPLTPVSPDEPTDIDNVIPVPNVSTENEQPPDTPYAPAPPEVSSQPPTTTNDYAPPEYFPNYIPVGEVPLTTVPETFPRFILPLTLVCILFVASKRNQQ